MAKLKDIIPDQSLGREVIDYINKFHKENQDDPRPQENIYPSSLGKCYREQWYKITLGTVWNPPLEVLKVMDFGTHRHDYYESMFDSLGLVDWKLTKKLKRDECSMSGIPDLVLNLKKGKVVVEIKTVGEKFFQYIRRNRGYRDHLIQLGYYMYRLKLPGVLLYENRTDGRVELYTVPGNQVWVQEAATRARKLSQYLRVNALPKREHKITGYKCRKCDFKKQCKKDGQDKVLNYRKESDNGY